MDRQRIEIPNAHLDRVIETGQPMLTVLNLFLCPDTLYEEALKLGKVKESTTMLGREDGRYVVVYRTEDSPEDIIGGV